MIKEENLWLDLQAPATAFAGRDTVLHAEGEAVVDIDLADVRKSRINPSDVGFAGMSIRLGLFREKEASFSTKLAWNVLGKNNRTGLKVGETLPGRSEFRIVSIQYFSTTVAVVDCGQLFQEVEVKRFGIWKTKKRIQVPTFFLVTVVDE
jgi:hypothetical protein